VHLVFIAGVLSLELTIFCGWQKSTDDGAGLVTLREKYQTKASIQKD
jgi:hypothetical protein